MTTYDRAPEARSDIGVGRRGELRKLLVAAADSARRGRISHERVSDEGIGRSVRERVLRLFRSIEPHEQRLAG
ncbi:MAG TPA: hypothetical protein VFZ21_19555 [Gemmatimonadaceae bacterium]|nr:hypothetical protein [Gemmatimonadaceae bacterium]